MAEEDIDDETALFVKKDTNRKANDDVPGETIFNNYVSEVEGMNKETVLKRASLAPHARSSDTNRTVNESDHEESQHDVEEEEMDEPYGEN